MTSTTESRSGLLGSSSPADEVSDDPPRYMDGRFGSGGTGVVWVWLDVDDTDEMEPPLDPKKLPSFLVRRGGDENGVVSEAGADPKLGRFGAYEEVAVEVLGPLHSSLKLHLDALLGSSVLLVGGIRRDAGGWGARAPVSPTAFWEMKSLSAFAHCSDASRASFASINSCLVSSISSRTFFSSFFNVSSSLTCMRVSCSEGDGERLAAVSIENLREGAGGDSATGEGSWVSSFASWSVKLASD